MSIPPIMIGAIARATDWENTTWSVNGSLLTPEDCGQTSKILPLVLQHLTPLFVSTIGLGAISAAVMSSADSSILSAASMFAHNIWYKILKVSQKLSLIIIQESFHTTGII